ncbi:hypothetical protein [Azospirillum sp. TSO22-1]|uniref:hypothetical protein n=1 Tax=Azospirillum sp. TSO22-1 TaxID=716789 RepID=UPI000D607501|nr:hypothetical protein [Azospirillum sp. TSO22-1]PWC32037.1 hypothetical protein TSO221_31755 [Azospirillum sp. TSO22-1]
MPEIKVNVLIDDSKMAEFDEVVRNCHRIGLQIKQKMPLTGTVTGAIEASRIDELKKVEGVSEIEISRNVGIPPPDGDMQ